MPSRLDRIVAAVQGWQANPAVHPLTCGNDSSHELLVAEKRGRKVVLVCPTCGHVQDWIPTVVIEAGSKMKPGKPSRGAESGDPILPALGESFEEAVSKFLKEKPTKPR